jgi:hypothetical protein
MSPRVSYKRRELISILPGLGDMHLESSRTCDVLGAPHAGSHRACAVVCRLCAAVAPSCPNPSRSLSPRGTAIWRQGLLLMSEI